MMDSPISDDKARPDATEPTSAMWLGSATTLTEIDADAAIAIDGILAKLVSEVELDFAALLDDSGSLLGWSGGEAEPEMELLVESSGALAMGTFAAAQVLASQLGGDASRELLHHAGSRGFHLTEVAPGAALFSVWTGDLAPGFLRDRTGGAKRGLARLLDRSPTSGMSADHESLRGALTGDVELVPMAGQTGENRMPGVALTPPDPGLSSADRYLFEIG